MSINKTGDADMSTIHFFMSFLPLLTWITYCLFFVYIPSWIYSLDDKTDYFQGILLVTSMCGVAYLLIKFMDLYYSNIGLFK